MSCQGDITTPYRNLSGKASQQRRTSEMQLVFTIQVSRRSAWIRDRITCAPFGVMARSGFERWGQLRRLMVLRS